MEIWLSTLDRSKIFRFPYINPKEVTFSSELNTEIFTSSTGEELMLIGKEKLKEIKINSFFPGKLYKWLPFNLFLAPACLKFINDHRNDKLLVTVISSENSFVMRCCISSFEYNKKLNSDIEYSITLKQYNSKNKGVL